MCQNITANPMPFFNEALVELPQRWHFFEIEQKIPQAVFSNLPPLSTPVGEPSCAGSTKRVGTFVLNTPLYVRRDSFWSEQNELVNKHLLV